MGMRRGDMVIALQSEMRSCSSTRSSWNRCATADTYGESFEGVQEMSIVESVNKRIHGGIQVAQPSSR